jgi:NAD(P) transhydrogenase subunit alpha
VSWSPLGWPTVGAAGASQQTPNLAPVRWRGGHVPSPRRFRSPHRVKTDHLEPTPKDGITRGTPVFGGKMRFVPGPHGSWGFRQAANGRTADRRDEGIMDLFITSLTIFVLAIFVGFEVITKVPPLLHTPLMSGSNAISGITIIGAMISVATPNRFTTILGFVAVVFAMINVVGGFMVTHRMLGMFKRKE